VDERLAGGSREEGSDDIGIADVGQLGALLGKPSDVLVEGFIYLLLVFL
jgi:hypothetical protein